jgi:hypothetical protein
MADCIINAGKSFSLKYNSSLPFNPLKLKNSKRSIREVEHPPLVFQATEKTAEKDDAIECSEEVVLYKLHKDHSSSRSSGFAQLCRC